MKLRRLLLPTLLLLALSACGDDDGSAAATGKPIATTEVAVVDNDFEPAAITVDAGATVTWTWEGSNQHNVSGDGCRLRDSDVRLLRAHVRQSWGVHVPLHPASRDAGPGGGRMKPQRRRTLPVALGTVPLHFPFREAEPDGGCVKPPRHRRLAVALGVVSAGIVLQAVLAGLFLDGEQTRAAHSAVGSLLPWYALVPAVLAVRRRAPLSAPLWIGAAVLPVGLAVQMVLGHVPWTGSTALHVPFGVLLFGGSLLLTTAAARAER